jgi:hypothetical protein
MTTGELNTPALGNHTQEDKNASTALRRDLNAYKEDYLRIADPTEYRFASRYIPGGWKAWEKMQVDEEYIPIIGQFRSELKAKLASDALARIIDAAQGETRDALSANKYIYETLTSKPKDAVGRPSNEKIQQKAKEYLEDEKRREEAYLRILGDKESND